MAKMRKAKGSAERIRELIRKIQGSAAPKDWPTYGMDEDEVIEHCRKVRERLWEEKLARHATRP